jgi:hypothetical protein
MSQQTIPTARFCPHCSMPIAPPSGDAPPRGAIRCENCRLLVGPGRLITSEERGSTSRGAAVGVMSSQARRDENAEPASPEAVGAAIKAVADQMGHPVERLRMTDYQRSAAESASLPELADVYSAFGTWKKARAAAALRTDRAA